MTFHQIRHYLGLSSREQIREQMPPAIEIATVFALLIAIGVAASLAGFPELGIFVAVGLVNVGWWVTSALRRRKRRGPGTST
jgi:hypothetical protein